MVSMDLWVGSSKEHFPVLIKGKIFLFVYECWMVKDLLSPDLFEVKDADLVNLPATVGALNVGFHLQDVVLR